VHKSIIITDELIVDKIYVIRGKKIMLDRDLAELYGVETKVLKQAVKRNLERFPDDFMFEMTGPELKNWRSQNVTSNSEKMGLRYKPFCFTEQEVAMLSSVLKSKQAIEVNIRIIRIFTKMREALSSHKDILASLEYLEKKVNQNDEDIHQIFEALKQLLNPKLPPRKRIGFKPEAENKSHVLAIK
jgi:hypothetical protein